MKYFPQSKIVKCFCSIESLIQKNLVNIYCINIFCMQDILPADVVRLFHICLDDILSEIEAIKLPLERLLAKELVDSSSLVSSIDCEGMNGLAISKSDFGIDFVDNAVILPTNKKVLTYCVSDEMNSSEASKNVSKCTELVKNSELNKLTTGMTNRGEGCKGDCEQNNAADARTQSNAANARTQFNGEKSFTQFVSHVNGLNHK